MLLQAVVALALIQDQSKLPEALQVDPGTLIKIYAAGQKDSTHARALEGAVSNFRRGIGTIRDDAFTHETVSWLWMRAPEMDVYVSGFRAGKQYFSDAENQKYLDKLKDQVSGGRKVLGFTGNLNIFPSFGGVYATIDRNADPADLKGVRVVLQVGDKILQPRSRPGDLAFVEGSGVQTSAIPQQSTSTTTTEESATAYGSGGYARATGTDTSTTTNYYTIVQSSKYSYYSGNFTVIFDLFDKDGNALIPSNTKEITAIVIYGANQRKATFNLNDILKFRKDHSK